MESEASARRTRKAAKLRDRVSEQDVEAKVGMSFESYAGPKQAVHVHCWVAVKELRLSYYIGETL